MHPKRIAPPFQLVVAWTVAVALSACDGGDPVEQGPETASTADAAAADTMADGGEDSSAGDDGDGTGANTPLLRAWRM